MVFVNVILIMKNLFSFFCPPCLLHFLLFQQAAALLNTSSSPGIPSWSLTGFGVCFMWRCACTLCCNVLFSVYKQTEGSAESPEHICVWFKQAFGTSWAFQGKDQPLLLFKTKGFPDSDISEDLGLFNNLLRVSGGAELRCYAAVWHECFS